MAGRSPAHKIGCPTEHFWFTCWWGTSVCFAFLLIIYLAHGYFDTHASINILKCFVSSTTLICRFEVSQIIWTMLLAKCKELRHVKGHKYNPTGSRKSSGRYRPYCNVDSFLKVHFTHFFYSVFMVPYSAVFCCTVPCKSSKFFFFFGPAPTLLLNY